MNRNILAGLVSVALMAMLAAPASAQTATGLVNVHGFVAARCGATVNGDSSFNGTINVGELTQTNGTLSSTFEASTTSSPMGIASFLVGCTGGGSTVTLSASRFSNPLPPGLPSSSNDIDYTAEIKIAMAAGGFSYVDYTTAATLPAPTNTTIPAVFANVAGNFEVRVFGFAAENGSSSLLVAGSYDSTITITVSPAA